LNVTRRSINFTLSQARKEASAEAYRGWGHLHLRREIELTFGNFDLRLSNLVRNDLNALLSYQQTSQTG
jgi:hypothetical protein